MFDNFIHRSLHTLVRACESLTVIYGEWCTFLLHRKLHLAGDIWESPWSTFDSPTGDSCTSAVQGERHLSPKITPISHKVGGGPFERDIRSIACRTTIMLAITVS